MNGEREDVLKVYSATLFSSLTCKEPSNYNDKNLIRTYYVVCINIYIYIYIWVYICLYIWMYTYISTCIILIFIVQCLMLNVSHSVMSDSLWPYGLWFTRVLLSMGFCRQEYWNWLLFPSPEDLPNPGIMPSSSALQADSLLFEL